MAQPCLVLKAGAMEWRKGRVGSTQKNHAEGWGQGEAWKLHVLKISVNSIAFLELLFYSIELN